MTTNNQDDMAREVLTALNTKTNASITTLLKERARIKALRDAGDERVVRLVPLLRSTNVEKLVRLADALAGDVAVLSAELLQVDAQLCALRDGLYDTTTLSLPTHQVLVGTAVTATLQVGCSLSVGPYTGKCDDPECHAVHAEDAAFACVIRTPDGDVVGAADGVTIADAVARASLQLADLVESIEDADENTLAH